MYKWKENQKFVNIKISYQEDTLRSCYKTTIYTNRRRS